MMRSIVSFFRMRHNPLPPGPLKKSERRIINDLLETKEPSELIAALDSGHIKITHSFGRNYESTGGQIKICMDIFGAEVHIGGGEMLDCYPQSYGFTNATSERLFVAIMAAYRGITSIEYSEELAHDHENQLQCFERIAEATQSDMYQRYKGEFTDVPI